MLIVENKIETKLGTIWLEKEIIHSDFKKGAWITLEDAKSLVKDRLQKMEKITRPFLSDVRNVSGIDNDARDYLASEEASRYCNSLAIVSANKFTNLYAKFYLKFSKPPVPTCMFTNTEAAIRWLQQFK